MLTTEQQEAALDAVAVWMGHQGYGGWFCPEGRELDGYLNHADNDSPCHPGPRKAPTGPDAANRGLGPMLNPEWDWPANGPTPTIILEGGPDDWAYNVTSDKNFAAEMKRLGIFAEPYAGYALCLYPED